MDIFSLSNPVIVTEAMTRAFLKMKEDEYHQTLQSTLERARKFAQSDDSAFSASLEVTEATQYADLVRTFLKHLRELEEILGASQDMTAGPHALVIAWWQVISVFKTMSGPVSSPA